MWISFSDNLQHDRNNFEPNALLEIQFYISSRFTKPQETLTIGHFWPNNWNPNIFLFHLYQSEVVWVHGYFFKSSAYLIWPILTFEWCFAIQLCDKRVFKPWHCIVAILVISELKNIFLACKCFFVLIFKELIVPLQPI